MSVDNTKFIKALTQQSPSTFALDTVKQSKQNRIQACKHYDSFE